ncbi:hypothetical protein RF11_06484 [Thelohanellus kitauei]|nr:hypothetical protein RF11_06484 [Thelohanellus kitauei]
MDGKGVFNLYIDDFITTTSQNFQEEKLQWVTTGLCNRSQSEHNTYLCETEGRASFRRGNNERIYKTLVVVCIILELSLIIIVIIRKIVKNISKQGDKKSAKN